MPAPDDGPWYRDGLRFGCTQCGRCCGGAPGFVWVSGDEARDMAAFLDLPLDVFMRQHTRRVRGRRSLKEYENGDCEFLDHDDDGRARCTIHPVRPLQCRTWPFWDSIVRSPRAWEVTARDCPGMNGGTHHPLPVITAALESNRAGRLDL